MGMQANFDQVTSEQLSAFIRDPGSAYDFYISLLNRNVADLFPRSMQQDAAEVISQAMQQQIEALPPEMRTRFEQAMKEMTPEAKARLEQNRKEVQEAMSEMFRRQAAIQPVSVPQEHKTFSLQKDWHVLHYALNGTAEGGEGPLGEAILGGKEIPDHQGMRDYGPLRYLDVSQVKDVAKALAEVDPQSLLGRLDEKDAKAKQIYLAHTLKDPADWSYLPQLFEQFRDFYADAARSHNGMLLAIV
jgi:AcrR family transcriptional regulator